MVQLSSTEKEGGLQRRPLFAACGQSSSTILLAIFVVALIALVSIHEVSLSANFGDSATISKSKNVTSTNDRIRDSTNGKFSPLTSSTTDGNNPSVSLIHATKASSPEQVRAQLEAMGLAPIYDPETTTDPWKVELFQRLDRIRIACGQLYQLDTVEALKEHTVPVPGAVISMAKIGPVDCPAILGLEEIDAGDATAPPIPDELKPYYTFNNTLEITGHKLRKDIFLGGSSETKAWVTGNVWKEDDINEAVRQVAAGTFKGTYGIAATVQFRDVVGQLPLRGKSVLVIGSSNPWVEVTLLHYGAAKVTTLEYGELISEHPKIKTMLPRTFREQFLAGTLETFDGVVSHSSLEHSGLGRYGDALNPWGDILAVARAWCVTKDGGFMYLGLPTGIDTVESNWHRTYGVIRWPLVAANWKPMPSTTDGTELSWGFEQAMSNGGLGYLFTKHTSGN